MIALVGWALRPVFLRVALLFGWAGAALLAFFANAAVMWLGLTLTPGVSVSSPATALLASWVYALLMTAAHLGLQDQHPRLPHRARHPDGPAEWPPGPSDLPGVIFVQLDGVPAPLLENEIRAGNIPTISRWLRSGTHTWTEWTARVPSTTPVSQAGLLHGRQRRHPGLPVVRAGAGPASRRQPPRRRRRHRGAGQHRPGPARRRRRQHLQPLLRRRAHLAAHDERDEGAAPRARPVERRTPRSSPIPRASSARCSSPWARWSRRSSRPADRRAAASSHASTGRRPTSRSGR